MPKSTKRWEKKAKEYNNRKMPESMAQNDSKLLKIAWNCSKSDTLFFFKCQKVPKNC